MKLIYPRYGVILELVKECINVLTIEETKVFSNMLIGFREQIQGNVSEFIVSEEGHEISLVKRANLLIDITGMDINEKRILTKLFKELGECATEQYMEQIALFNANAVSLLDEIISTLPYSLEFSSEFSMQSFLKAYNVRLADSDNELIDRLLNYIKVLHRICGIDIFILVNLKQYFSDEELIQLYKEIFYEDIWVVIVEGCETQNIKGEKHWLIDKEMCIIESE